jgi:hypothetical protein
MLKSGGEAALINIARGAADPPFEPLATFDER